jgi:LysR family transcriptional regulator, glycine cleavage system transcriptional activator
MDIDWHHLPPLTALRAFEATARLGGFSAAARVLSVTPAAVAQQVRGLEDHLGLPLVQRDGRNLVLTSEGEQLAGALAEGFGTIQTGIQSLRQTGERPVRISLSPGFAAQWLMPRLRFFWAAHPDIPLAMLPDHRVVDLRREGIDLAIRYGQGHWPGVEARYLTSARYVITAAPSLLRDGRKPTLAEMADMPWILATDWPQQRNWLHSLGMDPAQMKETNFPTEELALMAARQGLGLLVESYALVEDDLKSGRLVLISDPKEDLPAYFTVTLPGPQRRAVREFLKWLQAAA